MALGKATKRIHSKLNPSLQEFAVLDLMVAPGKNIDHIAAVEVSKNFFNLKNNLKKIILADYARELVEKFTKLSHSDHKIFQLLERYLEALNENNFENKDWQLIKEAFAVKFLILLGLAPTEDIATDSHKLDLFIKDHLDSELKTEKFLSYIIPLTS